MSLFVYSGFHPEAPLKIRNSAFCLVVPVPVGGGKQQENQLVALKRSMQAALPTNGAAATTTTSQSYSVQSGTRSKKQKLMCNIALDKTNRDRILLQEKGDFALAKMLQEFGANDAETPPPPPGNGTTKATRRKTVKPAARKKRGAPNASLSSTTSSRSNGGSTASGGAADNNDQPMATNGTDGDSVRTRRYFLRNRSKPEAPDGANKANGVVRVPIKATAATSRLKRNYK